MYPLLQQWAARCRAKHEVELVQSKAVLQGGDILFLVACHEIIGQEIRNLYEASLVVHASDLPLGRGWSPHIWQVLEGKNRIPVTLLEAEDQVDSGAIWLQHQLDLEGHETSDEIVRLLFQVQMELMDFAIANFGKIIPTPQDQRKPTYYRRRTPEDSRLDPNRTIAEQFDLIRVCDPGRFPAFFDFRGHRYTLRIAKAERDKHD